MKKLESGKTIMKIAFVMAFVLAVGLQESQGVIMTSGKIALGVDSTGDLNVVTAADPDGAGPLGEVSSKNGAAFAVGLSYNWSQAELDAAGAPSSKTPGFYDATAPACYCEGWGVSGTQGSVTGSGYVNGHWDSGAAINLASISFVSDESVAGAGDATTITSIASIGAINHVDLRVTQEYKIAPQTPTIWQNLVTITNTSSTDTISDVKYVRVMDWDVPHTVTGSPLEFTSVVGVGTTTFLERSHDGGFSSSDPLSIDTLVGGGPFGPARNIPIHDSTINVDFDLGPDDQGAYFRFNFGSLAPGASKEFFVFYGAATTKHDMLVGLQLVGTELYSLGQSNISNRDFTPTYAFAFKDVGGVPVVDVIVPEPGTFALLGIGLAGLGYFGRKRILTKLIK